MEAQMSASAAAAADDTWSKLPADLLGEVYGRIVSPLDRVRFTAVCRSWRVVKSRQQPAPTLPWLIFPTYKDGTMGVFCPMDGVSLSVPLPPDAVHKRLVGFHDGGWIAAASSRGGGHGNSLAIVNAFSGVEAPLSAKQRATPWITKLVCSDRPTVNRCILAAVLADGLGVCKVGCRNHNWWRSRNDRRYVDIAFYDGKLCGLRVGLPRRLHMYTISMTKRSSDLVVSITYELDMSQLPMCVGCNDKSYIFKHGDRMLMAKRAQWTVLQNRVFFKVFELTRNTSEGYRWAEVTTLDDHAMFLSTSCSKMMYVPADRRGGVERNHIYYNHVNFRGESKRIRNDVQLMRCDHSQHLYCRKDKRINGVDRIKSIGYYMTSYYNMACHYQELTWLLPPEF